MKSLAVLTMLACIAFTNFVNNLLDNDFKTIHWSLYHQSTSEVELIKAIQVISAALGVVEYKLETGTELRPMFDYELHNELIEKVKVHGGFKPQEISSKNGWYQGIWSTDKLDYLIKINYFPEEQYIQLISLSSDLSNAFNTVFENQVGRSEKDGISTWVYGSRNRYEAILSSPDFFYRFIYTCESSIHLGREVSIVTASN